MSLFVNIGTGRARCQECKELILKTEIDVTFTGYRSEKHYHKRCIDEIAIEKEIY